jgi:hypothetical protein
VLAFELEDPQRAPAKALVEARVGAIEPAWVAAGRGEQFAALLAVARLTRRHSIFGRKALGVQENRFALFDLRLDEEALRVVGMSTKYRATLASSISSDCSSARSAIAGHRTPLRRRRPGLTPPTAAGRASRRTRRSARPRRTTWLRQGVAGQERRSSEDRQLCARAQFRRRPRRRTCERALHLP